LHVSVNSHTCWTGSSKLPEKVPGHPDWGLGHVEGEEQKINLDLEFSKYVGWVVNGEA
jgi:hypothetical protein